MKKILTILFLFAIIGNLLAEISVKSFRKLDNDLDARVNYSEKDQNGDVCAIIKVVTTQTGFTFDGGQLGIVKTVQKPSEIWVYVPYGLTRLSIFHPQLGQLRDYMIPELVEKATVYELVLISGKVETIVTEEINSQWLLIHAEPEKAMIYINDQFVKTGEYQAKLKPGIYDYRVEMPLYHTEAGKIEITDTKKELTVNLKPAYGNIAITTTPESEATVLIDGKEQTKTTPCQSENLASGEHTVQVIKEMYQPAYQKVTITDKKITSVNVTLQPNFAELTVTAPEATIYVNNQQKTIGTWNGRLPAGVYSIEARREKYRSAKQDIELTIGDNKKVDLQPTPIYGSLDIMTSPAGAIISIDGKEYGTTPNTLNKLLIGDYMVQLSKAGYATVNKTVTIVDGKSTELNDRLTNGLAVTINSTPTGATLYIDGNANGTTPYTGSLTFGNHILRIESNGKKAEKTVNIVLTGGETNFNLSFGTKTITDIDGNVYHTIKIGTQTWMVENLKVTRYRNGEPIPNITNNTSWTDLDTGASCDYLNMPSNSETYGKLYNWYAVNDSRKIAPAGWHVPTDAEWTILMDYLGSKSIAGAKLKETGTKHWTNPNTAATNESGFSALPGGDRGIINGTFYYLGSFGYWWSSTEISLKHAWYRGMSYNYGNVFRSSTNEQDGFSVRCVRDF